MTVIIFCSWRFNKFMVPSSFFHTWWHWQYQQTVMLGAAWWPISTFMNILAPLRLASLVWTTGIRLTAMKTSIANPKLKLHSFPLQTLSRTTYIARWHISPFWWIINRQIKPLINRQLNKTTLRNNRLISRCISLSACDKVRVLFFDYQQWTIKALCHSSWMF